MHAEQNPSATEKSQNEVSVGSNMTRASYPDVSHSHRQAYAVPEQTRAYTSLEV